LKIAFDSWVLASRLRYQGTYVYARNLIAQFKAIAMARPEIRFCLFASSQAANDANDIEPASGFELWQTELLARDRLWRLGGASLAAARAHADLLFAPTVSIVPIGSIPVVCTIHDVTPVVMPSHSYKITVPLRSLLWWSAKLSRAIITDSECSKRDLVSTYGLPESKISVVYLGYDKNVFNDVAADPDHQTGLRRKFGIIRPYILHHGVIQPRKNLKRLIDAYRLMLSRNPNLDLDLVLAGPLGWQYDEVLAAAGDGKSARGHVILPGALSDSDLAAIIKGATLAVIPSLYEGFCLPMLEAMACGIPTLAANTSCLPEVSGGVLKYFDPLSIDDISTSMNRALESIDERTDLSRKGKAKADFYSWRRCAGETVDILIRQGAS
jgi:glycosyltransferase involved in cell wall biosynthesis